MRQILQNAGKAGIARLFEGDQRAREQIGLRTHLLRNAQALKVLLRQLGQNTINALDRAFAANHKIKIRPIHLLRQNHRNLSLTGRNRSYMGGDLCPALEFVRPRLDEINKAFLGPVDLCDDLAVGVCAQSCQGGAGGRCPIGDAALKGNSEQRDPVPEKYP